MSLLALLVPTFIDIAAHPVTQRSHRVPYSSDHSRLPLCRTAGCTASRRQCGKLCSASCCSPISSPRGSDSLGMLFGSWGLSAPSRQLHLLFPCSCGACCMSFHRELAHHTQCTCTLCILGKGTPPRAPRL